MKSVTAKQRGCVSCKWTTCGRSSTTTTTTGMCQNRDVPELANAKVEHDLLGIHRSELETTLHACESKLVAVGHIWDMTDKPEASKARQARQYVFDFRCEKSQGEPTKSFLHVDGSYMAPGVLPLHPNVCPVAFQGKHALPPWAQHLLPLQNHTSQDSAPERRDLASCDHHRPKYVPRQFHALVLGPFDATLHSRVIDLQGAADGIPDDVLEVVIRDIASGIMHLVRHAGMQGPLTMQNVVWDSSAGPEGIGRAMVVPSLEQLCCGRPLHDVVFGSGGPSSSSSSSISVTSASSSLETDSEDDLPEAASGAGSSGGSRTGSPGSVRSVHGADSADDGGSDDSKSDQLAIDAAKMALDGESPPSERIAVSPESSDTVQDELDPESAEQAAAWYLGVILHQLATGGKHPFWYMVERDQHDASDRRARIVHWHKRLKPRPVWLQRAIEGLMCPHAQFRLSIPDMLATMDRDIARMQKWKMECHIAKLVHPMLPALHAGGKDCDRAAAHLLGLVDEHKREKDSVSLMKLCYRVRMGVMEPFGSELPPKSWAVLTGSLEALLAVAGGSADGARLVDSLIRSIEERAYSSKQLVGPAVAATVLVHLFILRPEFVRRAMRSRVVQAVVRMMHSQDADEAQSAGQLMHWLINKGGNRSLLLECKCYEALGRHMAADLIQAPLIVQAVGFLVSNYAAVRNRTLESGLIPKLVTMAARSNSFSAGEAVYVLHNIACGALQCKLACVRAGAARVLLPLVRSSHGYPARYALYFASMASQGDNECKKSLVYAGWPAELVRLMDLDKGWQVQLAIETVGHLLKGCIDVQQQVVDAGSVLRLMHHLQSSTGKTKQCARAALTAIYNARESITGLAAVSGDDLGAILGVLA